MHSCKSALPRRRPFRSRCVRALVRAGYCFSSFCKADAASVGGANTLWLGERMAWAAYATPLPQAMDSVRQSMNAQNYHPSGRSTGGDVCPG